jgi:hypothetical protein
MPLCNKVLFFAVQNWFDTHTKSLELPNVSGKSASSFQKLKPFLGDETEEWAARYQYMPGLRRGDPGDLVLAYLKTPTRWRHHAAGPPWVFDERKWILISFDFADTMGSSIAGRVPREMSDVGENAERVSLKELKNRLRKTLKCLQENNRPHWQTVAAENEEFLR